MKVYTYNLSDWLRFKAFGISSPVTLQIIWRSSLRAIWRGFGEQVWPEPDGAQTSYDVAHEVE